MKDDTKNILDTCRDISFGKVVLTKAEESLYQVMNGQMIHLCNSLPRSMQNHTLLFLMQYGKFDIGEPLDFFRFYYPPAWSVIHWLSESNVSRRRLSPEEYEQALCVQAMAMFLHSLDDHMVDGEIETTHLLLLLRSKCWMLMQRSIEKLCDDSEDCLSMTSSLIDDYYRGISEKNTPSTIQEYISLFRKQMATWLVAPLLTASKISPDREFVQAVRDSYESFGIAWRLLDDINDIDQDIVNGVLTSPYCMMTQEGKEQWKSLAQEKPGAGAENIAEDAICELIRKEQVIDKMTKMIFQEMNRAAEKAEIYGATGLANQFRSLTEPLQGE